MYFILVGIRDWARNELVNGTHNEEYREALRVLVAALEVVKKFH